jgi:NAD(P)H-nitrite reductase large subunit
LADRPKRYVIIGNGVAGTTCAETLRKGDANCEITLLANEPYPLYNRVALPPFIKHKVPEQKVFLRTIQFHEERRLGLHLETEVTRVDTEIQVVHTRDGAEYLYDALVVATGGRPYGLRTPNANARGILNFQYFDDAAAIIERSKYAKYGVVVGGSFIAYELAEAFRANGIQTAWLIRGPRFLRRIIDEDGGALVDDIARGHGVETVYGEEVTEVHTGDGEVTGLTTNADKYYQADIVGLGVGLKLNTEFLADTPVRRDYGVLTNEFLETNVPNVYAAGDVAQFFDLTINRHNQMGTWGNATAHGRIAAFNILGDRKPHFDIPMYSSTLFDSYIRVIGLTPENYPDLESYARLDVRNRSYQRLFFLEDRCVGAVLIGEMRFRTIIFGLIKSREKIPPEERRKILED